jgi:hypothetical protein
VTLGVVAESDVADTPRVNIFSGERTASNAISEDRSFTSSLDHLKIVSLMTARCPGQLDSKNI